MITKFRFKTDNGYIEYKDRAEGESKHPEVVPEVIEEKLEVFIPASRKRLQKTLLGGFDFNDIKSRLNNLYAILETRFNYNIVENVHIEHSFSDEQKEISLSFGKNVDGNETWNKITSIINQLAHLKDPLKKKFKDKGLESKFVEIEIDSYPCLQIIIDISNSWKHGYPLDKERSKKTPEITNVKHLMAISAGEAVTSSYFGFNLQTGQPEVQGDVSIVIEADIVDGDGNYVYSFSQLINESTEAWHEIIEKYKV